MEVQDFVNRAESYFLKGYNCCQAVAVAFADVMDLSEDIVLKSSVAFGGGFARLRYVCGAVGGMGYVLGVVYGNAEPDCKVAIYAKTRELTEQFETQMGSFLCTDLLNGLGSHKDDATPEARTPEYYQKRKCLECVQCAARILAEDLKQNERI